MKGKIRSPSSSRTRTTHFRFEIIFPKNPSTDFRLTLTTHPSPPKTCACAPVPK